MNSNNVVSYEIESKLWNRKQVLQIVNFFGNLQLADQ